MTEREECARHLPVTSLPVYHLPNGERIVVGPGLWGKVIAERRMQRASSAILNESKDHD